MTNEVDTKLIETWLRENSPNAVAKLQIKADISKHTIERLRRGLAPKREATRLKVCNALGLEHDALFNNIPSADKAVS